MKKFFIIKIFIPIFLLISSICNTGTSANLINDLTFVSPYSYNINEKIPLSINQIDYILKIPKGLRPNPNTYLSYSYTINHLNKFQNGVSIIMGMDSYLKYINTHNLIGREDNTCFVMPTYICDEIDRISNGDISIYEKILSFDNGYFKNQHGLVRLDIKDIKGLNLRIPSGNELGANEYWIPGGYTMGGIPEAVCNLIPKHKSIIKIYNYEENEKN